MTKQKSFTLIELLVVIVIIGILAGVIMISTSSSIDKANIAKSKVFEESIENNLAANMVSRWKLDEIIGAAAPYTTPDQWGSNTGTLYGANGLPQLRPASECVTGGCFKFDGVDDYMNCGSNNLNFGQKNFTISAWIQKFSTVNQHIAGKRDSEANWYRMYVNSNDYLILELGQNYPTNPTNTVISLGTLRNNIWYHVMGIRNGTTTKIYIDGVLNNTGISNYNVDNNAIFKIGQFTSSGGNPFNGLIDDVRVYSETLTSSQIKKIYVVGLDSLLNKNLISKEEYNERIGNLANK